MRIVIALGGNALLRRGQPMDAPTQRHNARLAAQALADVVRQHQVILTHGNGPQVGMLALARRVAQHDWPLDVLVAETQGQIGYTLALELMNVVPKLSVLPIVTLVEVDPDDAAFQSPTKFIGPAYPREEAEALSKQTGWQMRSDGECWRRVVPSPIPQRIVGLDMIRHLAAQPNTLAICVGGGGIPVVRTADGTWQGVEAVVDKDLASALLAREIEADLFVIATDVPGVFLDHRQPTERLLTRCTARQLRAHLQDFPDGSMQPKVEAALQFVSCSQRCAAIGALDEISRIIEGNAGTWVVPDAQDAQLSASAKR